jgi:transcriptional regulator with XRE-family HTH domain
MGRSKRIQPKKLKFKLKAIRDRMELTQQEMVDLLKSYAPNEFVDPSYISQFENGKREPSLLILLAYSKITGVSVNTLIDDRVSLPEHIQLASDWIMKKETARRYKNE